MSNKDYDAKQILNYRLFLLNKGYTKAALEKIGNSPVYKLYCEGALYNTLITSYMMLNEREYSDAEIVRMTMVHPPLAAVSATRFDDRTDFFKSWEYSSEDIHKILYEMPSLTGYSKNNLTEKLTLFKALNALSAVTHDSRIMIQSVALTYARYWVCSKHDIEIDEMNIRCLFAGDKYFTKRFGYPKDRILNRYPYNGEIEDIRNNQNKIANAKIKSKTVVKND